MKQTSQRNDAPAARPADSAARAAEPSAAELKPNVLGAPCLQLLPGAAGAPRFAAGFVEAEEFGRGRDPEPRATFGEDEFAEEEEDEFSDEEEEDEFDDDEDEEDEFDDDEDEDDEFDDDEEEDDEEEDEELIADEEEEVEDED